MMDPPRNHVLADPRLALKKNCGVRIGDGFRLRAETLHGPALHDHGITRAATVGVVQALKGLQKFLLRGDFTAQIRQSRDIPDDRNHIGHLALLIEHGVTIQKQPPSIKNVLHAFYILACFHNLGVELRVEDTVQHHVLHTVSDYVPFGYTSQLRVTPVHQDADAIAVSNAHGVIERVAKFFDIIGQHSRCIHQPSRTDKEVRYAIKEPSPCSPGSGAGMAPGERSTEIVFPGMSACQIRNRAR
jgi:hypothetical protein